MIDSFPFDEWGEDIGAFWTFGPGGSTGTWILTILGITVMIAAWIGWFVVEHRKLMAQAEYLRGAGVGPTPESPPGSMYSEPPSSSPGP